MVIRGRTRGNGSQLGSYLLTMAENEDIKILEVDGMENATEVQLRQTLFSMSITSELTKGDKGLYHAQINPAYGDDKDMDWTKAADMLGKELGLENQRRVIVLHEKKGRTHAHVAWERYDHEKGILVSDSFSRLAQDRARKEMEIVFEHKRTPDRNPHRPEMKEHLSKLWDEAKTGKDFVKEADKAGYTVANGLQRRPFMVIDEHGRSFDLVRQLKDARTKDVREKLKGEKLLSEKDALVKAKARKSEKSFDNIQERASDKIDQQQEQTKVKQEQPKFEAATGFATNRDEMFAQPKPEKEPKQSKEQTASQFKEQSKNMTDDKNKTPENTGQEKKKEKQVASEFASNRNDTTRRNRNVLSEEELAKIRQETSEQLRQAEQNKERGIEYD